MILVDQKKTILNNHHPIQILSQKYSHLNCSKPNLTNLIQDYLQCRLIMCNNKVKNKSCRIMMIMILSKKVNHQDLCYKRNHKLLLKCHLNIHLITLKI